MTGIRIHSEKLIKELEETARQLRLEAVGMVHRRGQGHPGGSLSTAEILTVLYYHQMKNDPKRPDWEDRDRFILSKGHACSLYYSTLASKGYFPSEDLKSWGHIGCHLQGHPDRLKTCGVEMTSGSLGHGINIGSGLCLAARLRGSDARTYVLIGDGECQSGVLWEGVMTAAKYKLDNLTVILDNNGVQLDGRLEDIMPMESFRKKWEAFNWAVIEIDGHSVAQILEALDRACEIKNRPAIIIAHTVKGKGVSYMEGKSAWHGRAPTDEEYSRAVKELSFNG
jgi:transketolase